MQNWKSYFSYYSIEESDETLRIVFRWPMRVGRLFRPLLFLGFCLVASPMFYAAAVTQWPMPWLFLLLPLIPFALIIFQLKKVFEDIEVQIDKKQNTLFENGIAKLELKDVDRVEWNLFNLYATEDDAIYTVGLKMNNHRLFILVKTSGIGVNTTYRLGIRIAKFLNLSYIDNRLHIDEPVIWAGNQACAKRI